MNIINDAILRTILLTSKQRNNKVASSVRILDWHIDDDIVKAGNNYSTQVSRLTVRYQIQRSVQNDNIVDTTPRVKILFLKIPANAPLYEMVKKMGSYDNEVSIYTEVLPQMYTFNGDNDDDDYFTPKLYYFDDKQSLVLEDLSQSGYKCADRVQQLDVEHCFYALRSLAKFHALSVKLELTDGLPEIVKRDPFMDPETFSQTDENNTAFLSQILTLIDSLPQQLKDQYPNMVTYLRNISCAETWFKSVGDMATNISSFNVLNHGDFWTNNIMFKYDTYEMIQKAKLIDFQLTMWKNPVRDLIYFTITSMKFEVYLEYFPVLVKIYLDTLNKILRRLDCPTYDMQILLDDMDAMYDFALIVMCCVLPIIISDPDDPIDTKEMCKDDKFEVASTAKAFKQQHFQDISAKWFQHFARKGTLRM